MEFVDDLKTYRRTESGRHRRRGQNSRYRVRVKERQTQPPETIAVITNVSILTEMLSDSEPASAPAGATGDMPAVSVDGEQGDCQCSGPPPEPPAVDVFAPAGAAAGDRPDDAQGQQPVEPILAKPLAGPRCRVDCKNRSPLPKCSRRGRDPWALLN